MLKKVLKASFILTTTLTTGYYFLQREYQYDLGIYKTTFQILQKINPKYSIQMTKLLCHYDLLWKNQIPESKNEIGNISIPNPLGLASGFDIDGSLIIGLQNLGFGFIEIGSLCGQTTLKNKEDTNTYQNENNSIRYFTELPQQGILRAKANLSSLRTQQLLKIPIGVNLMPSEDIYTYSPHLIAQDLENSIREMSPLADYLVLNLMSSERTRDKYETIFVSQIDQLKKIFRQIKNWQLQEIGLQAAIDHERANSIIEENQARNFLNTTPLYLKENLQTPIYVKISSDAKPQIKQMIQDLASEGNLQGIIYSKSKQEDLTQYLEQLKQMRSILPKQFSIISVGEIQNKQDIDARLKHGANACQTLSAFALNGPQFVNDILK